MTGKRKLRRFLKKSGSIAVALMMLLSLAACNTHGNLPKPDDVDMGSEVVSEQFRNRYLVRKHFRNRFRN